MTADQYRAAREAMGLSQPQLAATLDVGTRTVQRIEGGEGCTRVMHRAIIQLAGEYGVNVAPLMFGEGNDNQH